MSRELGINNCIFIASIGQSCKIKKRKKERKLENVASKTRWLAALVLQRMSS